MPWDWKKDPEVDRTIDRKIRRRRNPFGIERREPEGSRYGVKRSEPPDVGCYGMNEFLNGPCVVRVMLVS
jgi:hypothetical protein